MGAPENSMADFEIAEILYENGAVKYRYSWYLASDGSRWIRHGLFVAYRENGTVVSEGNYDRGVEHGPWTDSHPGRSIAASGNYDQGNEVGTRRIGTRMVIPRHARLLPAKGRKSPMATATPAQVD